MSFWGFALRVVGVAAVSWLLRSQPLWRRRLRLGWALCLGARQLVFTFG